MTPDLEPIPLLVGWTALLGIEKVFLPLFPRNTDGCTPAIFPVDTLMRLECPASAGGIPAGRKCVRWRAVFRRRAHCTSPISVTPSTSAPVTGAPACFARPPTIPCNQMGTPAKARNPAPEVSRPGYADGSWRAPMPQPLASTDNSATTVLMHAGPGVHPHAAI